LAKGDGVGSPDSGVHETPQTTSEDRPRGHNTFGGWLRKRFEEIGVIQFEDWADTGEEYLEFDAVSQDRAAEADAG